MGEQLRFEVLNAPLSSIALPLGSEEEHRRLLAGFGPLEPCIRFDDEIDVVASDPFGQPPGPLRRPPAPHRNEAPGPLAASDRIEMARQFARQSTQVGIQDGRRIDGRKD